MATYDITQNKPTEILTGDILNCPYSGAGVSVTLPSGTFKLEVWGAAGGYYNSSSYFGKGGYSVGTLELTQDTVVYCYAGGQGLNGGNKDGGFNGGGSTKSYGGSGGGGSDIRIGTDSLYARIIVAGGGGGGGYSSTTGGYGGGTTGGSGGAGSVTGGYGGTQTSGGSYNIAGSFGTANANTSNGGGGGGGWYGGGSGISGGTDSGGGGGSGFVWTGSNAPSGYLLDSSHYLSEASTIAGNTSFPSTSGSTETGHSTSGYVRITVIEVGLPTPTNFRETEHTRDTVTLSWDAVDGAEGYRIYRDGMLVGETTSTTFRDEITPFLTHTYTLVAYRDDMESDPATLEVVVEVTPAAVSNLQSVSVQIGSVTLRWDAVEYATGYRVYRDSALITTISGTEYTDGVTNFGSYIYEVEAFNAIGDADRVSLTVVLTIPCPGCFQQTEKGIDSVCLSWDPVECDKYRLYRDGELLTETTATTYTDTGLESYQTYEYAVTSVVAEEESVPVVVLARTAEVYTAQIVSVDSAGFSENPTTINTKTVLTVTISEATQYLEPAKRYVGELYSGEV